MRRARDSDSRIGHNIDGRLRIASKTVPRIGAQIQFMVSTSNTERLR